MVTTTDKIAYATSATITCTFASMGSGTTVAQSSAIVDNSTNLYDDAMLTIAVKTNAAGTSATGACYIYLYASEDGTVVTGSSNEAEGTNVAVTLDNPTNLAGPFTLFTPANAATYRKVIGSVASVFGGVLPRKWGFVLNNQSGAALDSTEGNHQKTYSGITYTNT